MTLERRFWAKVSKAGECWVWTGVRDTKGYGGLYVAPGMRKAHRVSWEMHYGPIGAGLLVCHRCDNPPCVRPDHLFVGTAFDNMRDMTAKGRGNLPKQRHGEDSPRAKLTTQQVRDILASHAAGVSQTELGKRHGVTFQMIWRIVHGIAWKHVARAA